MKKDEVIARKAICQSLGKKRNLKFGNKNNLLMKSDTGRHWEYFFTAKININFFADHFAVNPILCCKNLLVFSSYLFIFLPFTPLFSLFFSFSVKDFLQCSSPLQSFHHNPMLPTFIFPCFPSFPCFFFSHATIFFNASFFLSYFILSPFFSAVFLSIFQNSITSFWPPEFVGFLTKSSTLHYGLRVEIEGI